MVDTIVLSINIRDPQTPVEFDRSRISSDWSPSIENLLKGKRSPFGNAGIRSHSYNKAKELRSSGLYFPRVRLLEVMCEVGINDLLRIEFSAPKLVFGNNFNELDEKGFGHVCRTLSERLELMGIFIAPKTLALARVGEIHYSKNILLMGQPIGEVFDDLKSVMRPPRRSIDHKQYPGGGQSFYIFSASHGLCLYDKKVESIRKRKKYASIYAGAEELPGPIDVLRIESRCEKPIDIGKTLATYDISIPMPLTFESLFKKDIAQKILIGETSELMKYIPPSNPYRLYALIENLASSNPKIRRKTIVDVAVALWLQDEVGSSDSVQKILGTSATTWWMRRKIISSLDMSGLWAAEDIWEEVFRQLEDFMPVLSLKPKPP